MSQPNIKIPVTVITGFLGSGKTTLINRILTEEHGIRFAVIENEFGEIGIDQDLVINENEEIIEVNNGCICCTVRGDLVRIIKKLVSSENPPEHILIETTGLADPSPVAQTFMTDPDIAKATTLDGIVTLVDCYHTLQHIDTTPEVKDQIAFADVILLTKTDLVTNDQQNDVLTRVKQVNGVASCLPLQNGTPLEAIFNIGGFDVHRALEIDPQFMEIEYPFEYGGIFNLQPGTYTFTLNPNGDEHAIKILFAEGPQDTSIESLEFIATTAALAFSYPEISVSSGQSIDFKNDARIRLHQLQVESAASTFTVTVSKGAPYVLFTEHMPEEFSLTITNELGMSVEPVSHKAFRPTHTHDEEVSSVGIELDGELDGIAFREFVSFVIQQFGINLYRFKGIVAIANNPDRVVLQGVHMLVDMKPSYPWKKGEKKKSSLVFIGKELNRNLLTHGFAACLKHKD